MKAFTSCTKKQQIERWENVLRVLRSLTPHQRRRHWNMQIIGAKTECGTVACACGHSSLDPWFRRRGYAGYFEENNRYPGRVDLCTPDEYEFFGAEGTDGIFFNTDIRPVGMVIKEVKAYIKKLASEADGSEKS